VESAFLVYGAIVTAFVGFVVGTAFSKYLRMRRAATEPVDGSECVACHSRDVDEFDAGCFRCRKCDFTWGDGIPAFRAKQLRKQLDAMPPKERRARALLELTEADAKLLSAESLFDAACRQLVGDLSGLGDLTGQDSTYSKMRSELLVKGAGELRLAQLHLTDAEVALGSRLSVPAQTEDPNAVVLLADMYLESIITDMIAHDRAENLLEQARSMRIGVTRVLSDLRASSATS
jgi:hypothetical protein